MAWESSGASPGEVTGGSLFSRSMRCDLALCAIPPRHSFHHYLPLLIATNSQNRQTGGKLFSPIICEKRNVSFFPSE